MKKSFGVIVLICFVLFACNETAKKQSNYIRPLKTVTDVEAYYFPFKEEPTIYKYDVVVKRPSGIEIESRSYVKFGFTNDGSDHYYISSFDHEKNLEDSIVMYKKSQGFFILSYSFTNENGGRTEIQNPTGIVFPFKRTVHDKSDYQLNYTTPVMGEMSEGNVSTSFSYKGITAAPNANSKKADCIKLVAKTRISLKSLKTQESFELKQAAIIYDQLGLGLYHSKTQEIDGSIVRRTFSGIVEEM